MNPQSTLGFILGKICIFRKLLPSIAACLAFGGISAAQESSQTDTRTAREITSRASKAAGQGLSNEKLSQPKRLEDSYPLASDRDREKNAKLLQQLVVDLLATFNNYKELHWNLSGLLYLPLHEFYQEQADYYRKQADAFAERVLSLGYSIDGRYATTARTTKIMELPSGYITDNESLKLQVDRIAILQKEIYVAIRETNESDPPTSNKLQDLAYAVDHTLWQLRIHLAKPGGLGQDLPWVSQQSRDRTGQ